MTKINDEVLLDFRDVLIRPKRSTLESRNDVNLSREFKFKHSKEIYNGFPVIAANMDGVGTFSMAKTLSEYDMSVALRKGYSTEDFVEFFKNDFAENNWFTIGISDQDIERLNHIMKLENRPKRLCVDVANGYTEKFVDTVKRIRGEHPSLTIMAGNVVTGDMTEALVLAGADIVKCGIGPGCLASGTRVLMANGFYKNIEDIKLHDKVINKDGNPVSVIGTKFSGMRKVKSYRNNCFYKKTLVTEDHKHWVGDYSSTPEMLLNYSMTKTMSKSLKNGSSKFSWGAIEDGFGMKLLTLPKNINFSLPNKIDISMSKYMESRRGFYGKSSLKEKIVDDYDLGYLIGTFLGDGHSRITRTVRKDGKNNTVGSLTWFFGPNEIRHAEKVKNALFNVFGANSKIVTGKNKMNTVVCRSNPVSRFFIQFYSGKNKFLPNEFMCSSSEYLNGLYEGLIDSDGHIETDGRICFNNTSEELIECFMILNYLTKGYFPSVSLKQKSIGTLQGANLENCKQGYVCRTVSSPTSTDEYQLVRIYDNIEDNELLIPTYDIEVDCPSHSFIANNSIVHNSVCTTRKMTGVGYPQLSAILECADAAHGLDGLICADGGCQVPGDISKAFGAGSDFVMLGGMLAGHDEGEYAFEEIDGERFAVFYGMSSDEAQIRNSGEIKNYRASEGKVVKIPARGSVESTLREIKGGVRSAMTYIGARTMKEIPKRTTFVRVSQQLNPMFGN